MLPINFDKCYIMSLTNKSCKLSFTYTINLNILSRVDSFRDRGIRFDSKLTFFFHISNITAEAFKTPGFIIRSSSSFNNITTFNTLYCAFVRSKLEYASIVWAPSAQFYIQSIEKIQRRFLKFLAFKIDANYPPRGLPQSDLLIRFGYNDLKTRRIRASLYSLEKLIHCGIDCPQLLEQLHFWVPRPSSRLQQLFYLPTPRIDIQKYSPLHEMCSNYNCHQNMLDFFK